MDNEKSLRAEIEKLERRIQKFERELQKLRVVKAIPPDVVKAVSPDRDITIPIVYN